MIIECNNYLYFSMSLRRAIAIISWDADRRANKGYTWILDKSVIWDSKLTWGTLYFSAVNWTREFKVLWSIPTIYITHH